MKEKFVTIPNLPQSRVSLAAVGNYPEIIAALNKEGIKTISFESKILPSEVSRHADMLICHIGSYHIFAEPSLDTEILKKEGFNICFTDEISAKYPLDVKLNVAVGNGFFLYNPKTADTYLTDELLLTGRIGVSTNQGYTKCSTCFVSENAVITEDPSIYKALKKTLIDVLLISKGDIYLSDKHEGFFGGSSGKIDKNTLAVTGELKYHKDGDKIKEFCLRHGVEIKELVKGRITDIGGILPLKS